MKLNNKDTISSTPSNGNAKPLKLPKAGVLVGTMLHVVSMENIVTGKIDPVLEVTPDWHSQIEGIEEEGDAVVVKPLALCAKVLRETFDAAKLPKDVNKQVVREALEKAIFPMEIEMEKANPNSMKLLRKYTDVLADKGFELFKDENLNDVADETFWKIIADHESFTLSKKELIKLTCKAPPDCIFTITPKFLCDAAAAEFGTAAAKSSPVHFAKSVAVTEWFAVDKANRAIKMTVPSSAESSKHEFDKILMGMIPNDKTKDCNIWQPLYF